LTGYDLDRNPEQKSLWLIKDWTSYFASDLDEQWKSMGRKLQSFVDTTQKKNKETMSNEMTKKLRELGYVK
jgi:hypothetical protein